MLEIIVAVVILGSFLQSIILYLQFKKISTLGSLVENQDVSIRRLNHRVIGEQQAVKGTKLPARLI